MLNYKCFSWVFILAICIAAAGCVPPAEEGMQTKANLCTVSKADFIKNSKAIQLPQNYSTRNYKRLVVAVNFFLNDDASNYQDAPSDTFSTMLETEISKLKRFQIVSRHLGQKGKMAEKKFQDMGTTEQTGKMRLGKGLNAEYSLTGGVSAVKEEYDRGAKNECLYIVRIDYQLNDLETDEIIEADMAEGRAKRTIFRSPSGKIIGGFSQAEQQDAWNQAAINALAIISNKIGNKLPIGGEVGAIIGSTFSIDKGYEEGFMGNQTVTLYTNYMGIDFPFAVGEITPGSHKTTGKIFAWSADPDVQNIIHDIKTNFREFSQNNSVYAVSNGMPLPPEWDNSYVD